MWLRVEAKCRQVAFRLSLLCLIFYYLEIIQSTFSISISTNKQFEANLKISSIKNNNFSCMIHMVDISSLKHIYLFFHFMRSVFFIHWKTCWMKGERHANALVLVDKAKTKRWMMKVIKVICSVPFGFSFRGCSTIAPYFFSPNFKYSV